MMLHFLPDTMQGKDETHWQPYTGRNRVEIQNIVWWSPGLMRFLIFIL